MCSLLSMLVVDGRVMVTVQDCLRICNAGTLYETMQRNDVPIHCHIVKYP